MATDSFDVGSLIETRYSEYPVDTMSIGRVRIYTQKCATTAYNLFQTAASTCGIVTTYYPDRSSDYSANLVRNNMWKCNCLQAVSRWLWVPITWRLQQEHIYSPLMWRTEVTRARALLALSVKIVETQQLLLTCLLLITCLDSEPSRYSALPWS